MTIAILLLMPEKVMAQAPPLRWSTPTALSTAVEFTGQPAIVADPYGLIHVFWTQDVGGKPVSTGNPASFGNTLFHRQWDGLSWSAPVDVIAARWQGETLLHPAAAVDSRGMLHLVWQQMDGIYHSVAPSYAAGNARSWSRAQMIAETATFHLGFAIDEHDMLHLAYVRRKDDSGDGNLYYIQSSDGGRTWSSPIAITALSAATETMPYRPRIATDSAGRLHLVWTENDPPDWLGTSVFYSRSLDGGKTWSSSVRIDGQEDASKWTRWVARIDVAVRPPDEVHLVWVCGERPYRCHQWSDDGGDMWYPVHHLFGGLHSLAYWDAVAIDSSDTIYWFIQLRYPEALYYTYWQESGWVDPPLLLSEAPEVRSLHGLEAAVRCGNELHLVGVSPPQTGPVWNVWATTPAKRFALRPVPTAHVASATTATPSPLSMQLSPPLQSAIQKPLAATRPAQGTRYTNIDTSIPLVIPVLLVVFLLMILSIIRSHRSS